LRLGILGGTFNPPHLGHLLCASEAASQLQLDRVLLVPVAAPPHKEAVGDPGARERYELCRLAVADDERLEVSRLEIDRGGPSYTVETLTELRARHPQDELTFIVGGDMALAFRSWREPDRILELATLAVAERSGATRRDIADRLGPAAPLQFFDMPRLDVSSSEIRRRAAEGRSIRYLVPRAVEQRIESLRLYA
jgi:nicotinate-nucleotide adenylyltransferase